MSAVSKPLLLVACLAVWTGCEGSPLGETLEQTLEPDPQLAASTSSTAGSDEAATEPGQAEFVVPAVSGDAADDDDPSIPAAEDDAPSRSLRSDYDDLDDAPEELQSYLRDLTQLNLLTVRSAPAPDADTTASTPSNRCR